MMKRYYLRTLHPAELRPLVERTYDESSDTTARVEAIIRQVVETGDQALLDLTERFDGVRLKRLRLGEDEIGQAGDLPAPLDAALRAAASHIEAFHRAQIPFIAEVVTAPGVTCRREWRPIRRVGLYVPGGSAPLISTALMLGIPARLAGCPEIVLCSPPDRNGTVSPGILAAARLCGIGEILPIGGAHAIAAMAVGTATVPKVDKIFGPGNRFVTMAKSIVSRPPFNTAIDMTAGPSEVLIIADERANPCWIAAELLAQAEHGQDSQAVLVTTSEAVADRTMKELAVQLGPLPRGNAARSVLERSPVIITTSIEAALEFSELYAPEHLVLAVSEPEELACRVTNAGSVFVGERSSVVFGDYASGTNHTLPTAGAARAAGALTVESFMKPVLFQTISRQGCAALTPVVVALARAEGLEAHARAAEVREAQS